MLIPQTTGRPEKCRNSTTVRHEVERRLPEGRCRCRNATKNYMMGCLSGLGDYKSSRDQEKGLGEDKSAVSGIIKSAIESATKHYKSIRSVLYISTEVKPLKVPATTNTATAPVQYEIVALTQPLSEANKEITNLRSLHAQMVQHNEKFLTSITNLINESTSPTSSTVINFD